MGIIPLPTKILLLTHISIVSMTCFLGVLGTQPSPPPPSQTFLNFSDQRLALVYPKIQAFKNTITLDPLNVTATWVGPDICSYQGFYCDHPPDNLSATALAGIDFNGFQLAAPSLDGFIDRLPDLAIFHANSNNFSGILSPNISKLPYFYELDLSNNNFSGNFPMSVLSISGLSFLDIRFNSFTGSLPPEVFTLGLEVLFLNNNNFMQNIPENLGSTPVLYLTLANNKFTGQIPLSIFNTSSTLLEILLLNNLLTGCVPYELGYLQELQLFDASNNLLTGPLPFSLGCLPKLKQLNFAGNLLYGEVPEVLCALENLANLSLSSNYFTNIGPLCRKLVKRGVLDIRNNCIHGLPDQRPWYECFFFFWHRPRYHCPYHPASFNFLPCKLHPWPPPPPPPPCSPKLGPKRNLISYKALLEHRM